MKKTAKTVEFGTEDWAILELEKRIRPLKEKYIRLAADAGSNISDLYWQGQLDNAVDAAYEEILARANKAKDAHDGKGDKNLTASTMGQSIDAKRPGEGNSSSAIYSVGAGAPSEAEGTKSTMAQAGKMLQTTFHILAAIAFCLIFFVDEPWVAAIVILGTAGLYKLGELFSPKSTK